MKKFILFATIIFVAVIFTGCKDPELSHEHTFADSLSKNDTHHWYASTCGHEVVDGKAAHTFGDWTTTKEATEEAVGSKERVCTVCNYKETAEIAQLTHTHKFATEWTSDATNHWYASTCGHTEEVSEKAAHIFEDEVCTVCSYTTIPTGFALIKAGTFQMGSNVGDPDEKPVHEVTLTKNFYMSKYEVTQGEYEQYCSYGSDTPSDTYGDGDNYPAYSVSWYDALVYCNKRSMAEGLTPCYSISNSTNPNDWGTVPTSSDSTWDGVVCDWEADGYRLPTEAEWEYAARAGNNTTGSTIYSGTTSSSSLGSYAWYYGNSSSKTHQVGTKKANAFGLYDMSGNVFEWCWNWKTSSYDTTTDGGNDPTGASMSGLGHVVRGGGWKDFSDLCSVSNRSYSFPYIRYHLHGFRVVRASFN